MAIKAEELMIGNWVKNQAGGIFQIFEITPTNYPIEGIPLSEEILLKCGFEKSSDNEHWFIGHHGFCLCFDGKDWCLKPAINNPMVITYVKYLHQLQNLYYCIVRTHLTFKP